MSGTIRAFADLKTAAAGERSIDIILVDRITKLSAAYGLMPTLDLRIESPPTINDAALFAADVGPLTAAFSGKIDRDVTRAMTLYVPLGIAKDGLGEVGVHTPDFTTSLDALPVGMEFMSMIAELGTRGQIAWR